MLVAALVYHLQSVLLPEPAEENGWLWYIYFVCAEPSFLQGTSFDKTCFLCHVGRHEQKAPRV